MPRKACSNRMNSECDPNGWECPGCSLADPAILDADWPKPDDPQLQLDIQTGGEDGN